MTNKIQALSLIFVFLAIVGCSDRPYANPMKAANPVDRYLVSKDGKTFCLVNDLDSACLTLTPKVEPEPQNVNAPVIHIYPEKIVYVFYREGEPVLTAEKMMDTTEIMEELVEPKPPDRGPPDSDYPFPMEDPQEAEPSEDIPPEDLQLPPIPPVEEPPLEPPPPPPEPPLVIIPPEPSPPPPELPPESVPPPPEPEPEPVPPPPEPPPLPPAPPEPEPEPESVPPEPEPEPEPEPPEPEPEDIPPEETPLPDPPQPPPEPEPPQPEPPQPVPQPLPQPPPPPSQPVPPPASTGDEWLIRVYYDVPPMSSAEATEYIRSRTTLAESGFAITINGVDITDDDIKRRAGIIERDTDGDGLQRPGFQFVYETTDTELTITVSSPYSPPVEQLKISG